MVFRLCVSWMVIKKYIKLRTCEVFNVVVYMRKGLINILAEILEKNLK